MDLQIAVFLLFALFTAGHALSCFQCTNTTNFCTSNCSSASNCYGATITVPAITGKVHEKGCAASCANGTVNFGTAIISSYCCNSELCNAQEASVSINNDTGKSCFFCVGSNCTNTVNCTGTEDRCIKTTVTSGNQTVVSKGCASKSICDAPAFLAGVQNFTCCDGNLCNGAQSVSQSFLFLCCSLISYFLLH